MQKADIENKLELCIESFKSVLYEKDETFLENMAKSNMDQGNLARYMLWEWTQGVGLYGLWKLFEKKHDQRCLDVLTEYYDARIAEGLPSKNINTMAPIFALSYLYEYTKNEKYGDICKEWAEWAMHGLPRAGEGGFQHVTSDRVNDGELWDDTLFMTVLRWPISAASWAARTTLTRLSTSTLSTPNIWLTKRPVCGIMVSALMAAITLPRLSGAAATAG